MSNELTTIEGPGPLNEIGTPKPPRVIDWKKPVRMVGRKSLVRIIAIDHTLGKPVVGVFEGDNSVTQWYYDGVFTRRESTTLDLENIPETPTDAQILDMVDGKAVSL